MERQKTYIKGFLDAARNKSRLDDSLIPDLMKEIEPYMVTDMTKDRYLNMALDFLGGNQDFTETDMVTLPGTAVETVIYDEMCIRDRGGGVLKGHAQGEGEPAGGGFLRRQLV